MKINLKYIWSLGLVLMLLMFAVMFLKDHRWRGRLKGDIEYQENPELSAKAWFDGDYQKDMQKYLEQNIGLRNYFVRSHNQIFFSVFNEAKARDVVIGSDNIFYEENYLKEYFGENAIDRKEMKIFVSKAKKVQKALESQGKEILFVVAPGKASMFPDNFPEKWKNHPKKIRNRDFFVDELEANAIPVIDASSWFVKIKDETKYPLYSETGIHWTHYGEYLFIDSLSNYLNSNGLSVSKLDVQKIDISNVPIFPDDDIEQGMNLLFDIKNKSFAYPQLRYQTPKVKSNAILIGDSYLWNMFVKNVYVKLFHKNWYYYYNIDRYSYDFSKDKTLNQSIRKEDLNQTNCVILLSTEANLHRLYFESINDLYDILFTDQSKKNK